MALLRFRAGGQNPLGNSFLPPPFIKLGTGSSEGIDDMYPPPPAFAGPTPPHQQQPLGDGGGFGAVTQPTYYLPPTFQQQLPLTCSRRCSPRVVVWLWGHCFVLSLGQMSAPLVFFRLSYSLPILRLCVLHIYFTTSQFLSFPYLRIVKDTAISTNTSIVVSIIYPFWSIGKTFARTLIPA